MQKSSRSKGFASTAFSVSEGIKYAIFAFVCCVTIAFYADEVGEKINGAIVRSIPVMSLIRFIIVGKGFFWSCKSKPLG